MLLIPTPKAIDAQTAETETTKTPEVIEEYFFQNHFFQVVSFKNQRYGYVIFKGDKVKFTSDSFDSLEEAKGKAQTWLNERAMTKHDIAFHRFYGAYTPEHPVRVFFEGCDKEYTYQFCSRSDLRAYLTGLVEKHPNAGWQPILEALENDTPFTFEAYSPSYAKARSRTETPSSMAVIDNRPEVIPTTNQTEIKNMQETNLETAFEAFKQNPNAANAWNLQQAMVAYAQPATASTTTQETGSKEQGKKKRTPAALKTKKGGKWDAMLKEILELFAAFDWEVIPYKSNSYIEAWKVTDIDLNQAILYLSSNGFSLGGKKPGEVLKGQFEGYEDLDMFNDFLVSNDIEIDE